MSEKSPLRKFSSRTLIGIGALSVVSAITGIVSAYALIEPSDKQAVDITPGDFVGFYVVMILIGAGLVFFGFRLRK